MQHCIFCKIAERKARAWMIAESETAYAILDLYPMNRWHTIAMPKAHYVNIFDLHLEVLQDIMVLIKEVTHLYKNKLGLENIQIFANNGAIAQQDVFHSHWHILPRYADDGQNIKRKIYPEMAADFDAMLKQLGTGEFIPGPIE